MNGTARRDGATKNETGGDPLIFTVMNEIGIIQQLARAEFERVLPAGLHLSHFSVLNHFVRLGGSSSPARLAAAFQVTRGAMTNTLRWLAEHDLVSVTPDPADGRAKIVRITPAGRRMRARAVRNVAPVVGRLEAEFSVNAFAGALPFLQQMRKFLDENRGSLSPPSQS